MSNNKENFNIWSLLSQIPKLIKSEVTTTPGKVNLVSDLVLAAVVVAIFTVNTVERIVIAVVSIWNNEIIEHLSDASTLIAFIILVCFFVTCLIFLYFYERIVPRTK